MKVEAIVFYVLLQSVLLFAGNVDAYRILGIFPAPAYSHYALGSRLMKALAEKGHDVTFIAPFKEKNPPKFYREIVLTEIIEQAEGNSLLNSEYRS